mgnify:CR=1 FL=1
MKNKIEKTKTYTIRHCTEQRWFTGFKNEYWKQWSLSLIVVKKFTDLNEVLDVLNKLNEEIIKANPAATRKHKLE